MWTLPRMTLLDTLDDLKAQTPAWRQSGSRLDCNAEKNEPDAVTGLSLALCELEQGHHVRSVLTGSARRDRRKSAPGCATR
jgi:hypothetical protein